MSNNKLTRIQLGNTALRAVQSGDGSKTLVTASDSGATGRVVTRNIAGIGALRFLENLDGSLTLIVSDENTNAKPPMMGGGGGGGGGAGSTVFALAPLTGNGAVGTPLGLADGANIGDVLVWDGTNWVYVTSGGGWPLGDTAVFTGNVHISGAHDVSVAVGAANNMFIGAGAADIYFENGRIIIECAAGELRLRFTDQGQNAVSVLALDGNNGVKKLTGAIGDVLQLIDDGSGNPKPVFAPPLP